MQNSYFSSVHCSFRSNGSLPFAFNDYSHFLSNQRCDRTLSCCCTCCCRCCCSTCSLSNGVNVTPVNRPVLYGLRQSNLLQWSASKRLVLGGGGDKVYCRVLSYGRGRGCYEVARSSRKGKFGRIIGRDGFEFGGKESDVNGRIGRRIRRVEVKSIGSDEDGDRLRFGSKERSYNVWNGRRIRGGSIKCVDFEEESDGLLVDNFGGVDEVINLLSEQVSEDCFVGREVTRKGNVSRRAEVLKGGKCGGDSLRSKNKISCSGSANNNSKSGFEVAIDERREEYREKNENKANVLRDKNRRERKESSSCSSYYSLSSGGYFEYDTEFEGSYGRTVDESAKKQEVTDRARNKVSTSEIQRDEEILRKQLVDEREHHRQRSSTQQSQSLYKDSNFRRGGQLQITTMAESLERPLYGNSGSGSCASHVDGIEVLHKEQYGTERSENYGKTKQGSVLLEKPSTQYARKEGQYKQGRSSQHEFESHSSGKNSLNETMSRTSSQKASVSRSGTTGLILQSEGVTALDQERYKQEKKDVTFSEPSKCNTGDTAQDSAVHLETSSKQFVEKSLEKEQCRLKHSTQHESEHTSKHGDSMQSELMSKSSMKEAPTGASGSRSSVLHYHGGPRAFHQGLHIREEEDRGQSSAYLIHEDTLGSVRNIECSSSEFVGESMEKARSEVTTSELQENKKKFRPELAKEREGVRKLDGSQVDQHKELHSRLISEGSGTKEPSDGMWDVAEQVGASGSRSSVLHYHGEPRAFHQGLHIREERDWDESSTHLIHEDTLGSFRNIERCTTEFVGEFMEKARSEVTTSEVLKDKKIDLPELANEREGVKQLDGSQVDQHKEFDSRHISEGSVTKGPSDEMRDVAVQVGASGSRSSVLHYHGGPRAFHQGLHIREERDQGESSRQLRHANTMDSARDMEHSSAQFIQEFMEKAGNEISASEVQKDKMIFQSELAHESERVRQIDSTQADQHNELSRHTSKGPGTKGPSDEMWDVTEPPVQEAFREEEQEAITTENAVVRRSGKSFWNIVADVVRLRWVPRAETPKSTGRSNGKSPSYDSASETWFTGREHERNDEDTTGGRRSFPQVTGSQLQQKEISSPNSGVIIAGGEVRYHQVEASTSSSSVETSSAIKDVCFTSPEENPDWDSNGERSHLENKVSPVVGEKAETMRTQAPGICLMESTEIGRNEASRRGSQMRETGTSESYKSKLMEKIETGRSEPSRAGLMQPLQQLEGTDLIEPSTSGERDMELKRRKLQRNKQVPRDRFDEWEEACRLDIEQRNMDEMFMREALLEAQKAADSWEVPVGAVLVQHGRIIARGCNLVEELRDSTAHAEMICIREGSNVLRSWRLAETTLYVTLEPCPMCAGAILQARIDTLVWGAPNKLLGADGSWIRLFPDVEGGNGLEGTGKPAAPVHPFHPKMKIRRGVLASECAEVMQQFFQLRRRKEKKAEPSKEKKKAEPPKDKKAGPPKDKKAGPPKDKKAGTSNPRTHLPVSHHPSKFLTKMHQMFHIFC